ncbi:MAG: hypothetical protein L0Y71_08960 [Gemmataceae bacterium]|nr:hypothetical protein [Gemmataceae bacterium]
MASLYTVTASKRARDQLADLHIAFRQRGHFSRIAFADYKIVTALEKNPQGGQPISGTNFWSVTVRPIRATYEILGNERARQFGGSSS